MRKVFIILMVLVFGVSAFAGENCDRENGFQKRMEIPYEHITLSGYAYIESDTGYLKLYSGFTQSDAARLWQDLEAFKARGIKKVKIYINSPGGSATDGMAMANILESFIVSGGNVEAKAYGVVASSAVPIFAVCNKRIAQKSTLFMVHPAKLSKYGYLSEELKDLDAQRQMMSLIKNNYLEKLASYTKLSIDEWEAKEKETTYFDAQKAKEWGLVDSIE